MGAGATTSAVSNPRFSVSLYLPPSKISYADLNVGVILNIASHSWMSWTEEDEDDDDDAMLMTSDAAAMVGMMLIALFGFDLIQKPRKIEEPARNNGAPRRSWYKSAVGNRLRILTTIPTWKIWELSSCSMAPRRLLGLRKIFNCETIRSMTTTDECQRRLRT